MAKYHNNATSVFCHHPAVVDRSGIVHADIAQIIFVGHVLRIDRVLLQHVPLPVVLPGEGFCALPGIIASWLGAVEFAGFRVLVVDVAFQMRDRAKASPTPFMLACARPFMVASVVAAMVVSFAREKKKKRSRVPLT